MEEVKYIYRIMKREYTADNCEKVTWYYIEYLPLKWTRIFGWKCVGGIGFNTDKSKAERQKSILENYQATEFPIVHETTVE